MTRIGSSTRDRVLRCVPDAGSGETIRPNEIAGRLDMREVNVLAALHRAHKAGLVVRIRSGDYQLAPRVKR